MHKLTLLPLFLSTVLFACSGVEPAAEGPEPIEIEAWTGDLPISAPWLRDQLPTGVLTYERIPHPLGLMAIPKGNTFDTALGSQANIQNLINVQQGLAENLALELPPVRFLENLRSPIEIAAVAFPMPFALIGATLSFRSNTDFEAFIAELGQILPVVSLAGPLDDAGFGQFVLPPGMPVPVQVLVHFDAATGRVALYAGIAADQASFAALLEPPAEAVEHPMHTLEAQIDDSGQGLFAWIDAAQALQAGGGFIPPNINQVLRVSGANQVFSVGVGAGVANGKGRLKLVADLGTDSPNRLIPVVNNEITATSVGDPRSLLLFSIPSAAEFTRLESVILANFPPETLNEWNEAKAALAGATGTSIEEILSAIGPELITVSDRAGDYIGLHVHDSLLLANVLDRWTTQAGVTIDEREVEGQTIRYVDLPGTIGIPEEALSGDAAQLVSLVSRMRSRIYWVEDGDYLYLASTPQLLIDRVSIGADTSIVEWLDGTQRVDMSSSLVAATGTAEKIPRMLYNGYVGLMQTLADMVGVEYDIWAMPTANQLGLPERGALGFSVNLGEPYVSLELSYESHPAEILFGGGGMAAVAAAGIAAAVAIPAYQDYTIRAHVSEGLVLTESAKAAVTEAYLNTEGAPTDRADAGMMPEATDTAGQYVQSVDVADGEVIVTYGNAAHADVAGKTLAITPFATSDNELVWVCGYAVAPPSSNPIGADVAETTVQAQHLPSGCR